MALYRREGSKVWWTDITSPDGKRHRITTKTEDKQLAQAYHDKLKVELWKESRLDIKRGRLFEDAVEVFLKEKSHCKSLDTYEMHLAWWMKQFRGMSLSDIKQELIVETIAKREGEVSAATLNRHLATLRATLRLVARKYRWIEKAPEFFMYKEPKGRTRWLRPEEIPKLLAALPVHRREMAIFSLATGLRQGNVKRLQWSQVDLERRTVLIDGEDMKAGRDHAIPLPEAAVEVLRRQIGKHEKYVFTYMGKPIISGSNSGWKRACREAGIEDFRQHDMRHTWATTLVQAGVPDNVLQALGAWETPKMVKRYAHHSTDSMRPFTARVDDVLRATLGKSEPVGQTHHGNVVPLRKAS